MVKALVITLCLTFVAGCGGNSKKSKTVATTTTLESDLRLPISDKKSEEIQGVPSIPDGPFSGDSESSVSESSLPDLLKVQDEGGSEEAPSTVVAQSGTKKAPPATVPWPKGMGPKGSGSEDPLNTAEAVQKVQNNLDSLAQGAETKAEGSKPDETWQKLVDVIAETGESQESRMGFYVSRSEFTPENKNKAHVANHISVVGGPKPDGTFGYSRVEASWEDWKITPEGYLDGDLWMFLVSRDGNLAKFWRYNLVKKTNGTVIKHQSTDITQELAEKKWQEIKELWIKKLVK